MWQLGKVQCSAAACQIQCQIENITNTSLALSESVATKMPFLSENARNKTPLQYSIHVYLDIKATEFNLHHFYTFTSVHLLKKISWRFML